MLGGSCARDLGGSASLPGLNRATPSGIVQTERNHPGTTRRRWQEMALEGKFSRYQKPEPPRRARQVRGTVSNGCYNLGGYTSDATPFEAQFGRALTPRRGPRLGGWPAPSLAPLDDRRFMSCRISDRPALGTARRVVGPAEQGTPESAAQFSMVHSFPPPAAQQRLSFHCVSHTTAVRFS